MSERHQGGCHGGKVRFEATADLGEVICSKLVAVNFRCLDNIVLSKPRLLAFDGKSV